MSVFPRPDARARAALAALAAVAALVTLLAWRPPGVLSVALALLCVLLGMIAGVTVSAARAAAVDTPAVGWAGPDGYEVDADTLESFDPHVPRDPGAAGGPAVDADTLEALDPREVQSRRVAEGLSDR
ncbi:MULTISPECIES: hypothetical protein [Micromonospora]|uniref:Uncharacterized protein n=1 Tax=Micromonospora solifontis TaxID=2487138 RepID=A0ABX9WIY0_9ACTN|nr:MULTISPECIES: hypothetical protein [Micromonospora]NES17114.1 hypothetical protein [Micromonospora sp. PPF5-17B]NES36730.1 hypothetical protein [Micromonospora solifontis]NES55757.1 hypothetical protein [Micromonospora sp. PPF5-6]RNL99191.1 hypothetical protein EFE23_11255 [Micromonospora solifontis]